MPEPHPPRARCSSFALHAQGAHSPHVSHVPSLARVGRSGSSGRCGEEPRALRAPLSSLAFLASFWSCRDLTEVLLGKRLHYEGCLCSRSVRP